MSASQSAPATPLAATAQAVPNWDRALAGLLLVWTFVSCCYPLHDTDFWWHLKTGELMWEQGVLFAWPQLDWYTFTDFDKPWTDLHWGFQLLIAGLYHAGGPDLVILVKSAVLTAAVGFAYFAAGSGVPTWQRVLCWVPAVIAISGRGYERPEMLTQLFLALWLWILFRLEQRPRLIWWLPVVQMLWVNCHALFVLGLVAGACYGVDVIVRALARGRWGVPGPITAPPPRTLMRAGLLILLAAFVNPYFEEGALFPLELYRKFSVEQAFYSVRIGEFQQPLRFVTTHGLAAFRNPYVTAELALWLMTALSFAGLARYRRWSPFRLLLFIGFSHLAWEASRNTNIFALVSGVMLCANLAEIRALRAARQRTPSSSKLPPGGSASVVSTTMKSPKGTRAKRATDRRATPATTEQNSVTAAPLTAPAVAPADRTIGTKPAQAAPIHARGVRVALRSLLPAERGTRVAALVLIGLIAAVVSGGWNAIGEGNKPFALGEMSDWFIHDAARFAGQPGFPSRAIVANNGQASVYIYHNARERTVFMDGRLEVVTRHTFEQYETVLAMLAYGDRRWEPLLAGKDGSLPAILLDSRYSRAQINGLLQTPGWRLVFADKTAAVFLTDKQADALSLPAANPEPLKHPPGMRPRRN